MGETIINIKEIQECDNHSLLVLLQVQTPAMIPAIHHGHRVSLTGRRLQCLRIVQLGTDLGLCLQIRLLAVLHGGCLTSLVPATDVIAPAQIGDQLEMGLQNHGVEELDASVILERPMTEGGEY